MEPILKPTYGCIVYQEQVMQIVRDLAGYTWGRSDEVRRAMSKKKADVMEQERKNFVYGNEAEGVPGCIKNGISEKIANEIFDEMIDFAKYAFNKSHAAAYAVVAYQTAYLKCYYPVEFYAALLTSVLGNPPKVAEYILACRKMGITILPPDINEGESGFSVANGAIVYGLSAIKSLGTSVIDAVVMERNRGGKYTSLKDFASRLSSKEVNKRTIENLIKAGAMDSLGYTRKQQMSLYGSIIDSVNQEKKNNLTGQMSMLDFLGEEEKKEFDVQYPDIGEYEKQDKLSFEKEVLGVYVSGHPLEDDIDRLNKHIVGGMIDSVTIKITKNNQNMAFLRLEDLVGSIEIIVFPRDFEKYRSLLKEEQKVFIRGRASISEEEGKLILEKIVPFSELPKELWIQFPNKQEFISRHEELVETLKVYSGKSPVVIYCKEERVMNRLSNAYWVREDEELISALIEKFGENNIKIVEHSIN